MKYFSYLCIMNSTDSLIENLIQQLLSRIDELTQSVREQNAAISRLNRLVEQRDSEIRKLKARLSKYEEPPKNSGNSSVPPTQDPIPDQVARRTRSLRKPSGRKSGGQPNHKGRTLEFDGAADEEERIVPEVCEMCGRPLDGSLAREASSHYEIDFVVVPRVVRTVSYKCKCSCGHITRSLLPEGMRHGLEYGKNVRSVVTYLVGEQCVSFKRTSQMMSEVFGVGVSEGTIRNILKKAGRLAAMPYEAIREFVEQSRNVGGDETGLYVDGELHWGWVAQNKEATYIFQDKSRGKKAIEKHFPDHFPNAVLESDRHSAYYGLNVAGHQVCTAHLLRNLEYLNELDPVQTWSREFQQLIRDALDVGKEAGGQPADQGKVARLKERAAELLSRNLSSLHAEFEKLRKGIAKWEEYLFTFLTDGGVSPDNNASERAIRNIKTKQKVSGCFRTNDGADIYMMIKSIMETANKNGQSKYEALQALANL